MLEGNIKGTFVMALRISAFISVYSLFAFSVLWCFEKDRQYDLLNVNNLLWGLYNGSTMRAKIKWHVVCVNSHSASTAFHMPALLDLFMNHDM